MVSIIRDSSQCSDITSTGASPLVLSLEDDPVETFAEHFTGIDVVYFSAGAGGQGGEERTKKVDYEGAVKVFDALVPSRAKIIACIAFSAILRGLISTLHIASTPFPPHPFQLTGFSA